MKLDFSSLIKAVESIEKTLDVAVKSDASGLDANTINAIKAGVIQNFEFTYELCWKFMKRWLRENAPAEQAEHPRARKELFRLAAQYGLIDNPAAWFTYGDARNLTSHTYDEDTAESVYETAVDFAKDARSFLNKLQAKNE
ncbi:MAG: nucleotidyltransferase substrate binding protein [Phycisphaerae bacterium]